MTVPLTIFTPEGMEPDKGALDQMTVLMEDTRVAGAALMADHHLGYSMPIGGVVAYDGAISPTGVGFDIACGNKAVETDLNLADWAPWALDGEFNGAFSALFYEDLKKVMREIQRKVAFGIGRKNPTPVDHELFDSQVWLWLNQVSPGLKDKAADQLGTVGSGNHYVDLLVDSKGKIWVANHFGSRGLGHTIASGFFALNAGLNFSDRVPEGEEAVVFPTDSEIGAHYIACMELAGQYAYAGRDFVIEQVLGILGAKVKQSVHNHHNYAWQENGLWVVRKGATPLTREPAFIGGSMGDISVIVREKLDLYNFDNERGEYPTVPEIGNIGSAPHGAGRVMSRTAAAGKMRKFWVCSTRNCNNPLRAQQGNGRNVVLDDGTVIPLEACPGCGSRNFKKVRMRDPKTAAIDWDAERNKLTERGIVVLGAGADEAPGVYKDLATVLAAHPNIEIIESLRPIGVVMAGADEVDPYKD